MSSKKGKMDEIKNRLMTQRRRDRLQYGAVGTIIFCVFTLFHMSLSINQYDVTNMNEFNRAVTLATIP